MENVINTLHLSGKVVGTPVVGHEAFGEKFYYLTLGVPASVRRTGFAAGDAFRAPAGWNDARRRRCVDH